MSCVPEQCLEPAQMQKCIIHPYSFQINNFNNRMCVYVQIAHKQIHTIWVQLFGKYSSRIETVDIIKSYPNIASFFNELLWLY